MSPIDKKTLELLVSSKKITEENLQKAQTNAQEQGIGIDQALVRMGMIKKQELMEAKAKNLDSGIECLDLSNIVVDPQVARIIPMSMAQRHHVICIEKQDESLVVAMANTKNLFALDDIRLRTGYKVEPRLAFIDDIIAAIGNVYEETTEWTDIIEETGVDEGQADVTVEDATLEAPVVKLVNMILSGAIKRSASDVHIEPFEKEVIVRYRIDGVLHEIMAPPKALQQSIISRIKIMSGMDIGEKRLPQDGRARIKQDEKPYDLRVSTLPTIFGESVVIRILNLQSISLTLEQLGFASDVFQRFNDCIHQPHGIILVTGPTGSGKSTTLYSTMNTLNSVETKILTIEDPVEYNLKGINQVQAQAKIGLTFAAGLRTFLRQDPDIILVGEIRDHETANIAMESALTGHLVLSTLHTNSAVGSITRLMDMQIEPFMISSTVLAILAQRLLRKVCSECKVPMEPSKKIISQFIKHGVLPDEIELFKAEGCSTCGETGYKGRVGVYELMVVNDEIRRQIIENEQAEVILEASRRTGMKTLVEDAFLKAAKGVTTLDEVYRVLHG